MKKPRNLHIGSSFDEFLREEGLLDEVEAVAIKRVLARRVATAMKQQRLTKAVMARRMRTSRMALDRFLDPDNTSVTLNTIIKAATAVGKRVRMDVV